MARQDSEAVRAFQEFGMRHIREQLAAAEGRFVDKAAAYDAVVAGFKAEYGWPADLTELERTVGGKLREVYINLERAVEPLGRRISQADAVHRA